MPCDGALKVMGSGFELQIHSKKDQSVRASDVDSSKLSTRQRFTMAHEISHTFFYDADLCRVRPRPAKALLEWLCNYGAQCLLLPEFLLDKEFDAGARLDSIERALNLARAAKVPLEAVVRRLDEFDRFKEVDFALIILDQNEEGELSARATCLSGAFSSLPKPQLYSELPKWVFKIAPYLLTGRDQPSRVPFDHHFDYISRSIRSTTRPQRVFLEARLDPNVKNR